MHWGVQTVTAAAAVVAAAAAAAAVTDGSGPRHDPLGSDRVTM